MATDAEEDDFQFSSDEMDPETEALLYSRIHHQETFELETPSTEEKSNSCLIEDILNAKRIEADTIQTDSGICSPKGSRSSSPLEESRLQRISTPKVVVVETDISNSSSDEDNGIKVIYENVSKLKESHIAQKKNVSAYINEWKGQDSSDSSSGENDSSNLDIKLNIKKEKKVKKAFQSFEKAIGKNPSFECSSSRTEYWPEHMTQFYDDINHSLKNKTLEEIWEELPDDPHLWKINDEDRIGFNYPANEKGRYFKKPLGRCTNCREMGHSTRLCPSPRKQIRCSMCGGHHRETRCDQSMCLRCGVPNRIYTRGCNRCLKLDKFRCSECFCFGHETKNCPNTWRRYHLTTHEGELVCVNNFVPPEDKWCPNCAKKGHYLHQCTAYLVSSYPASIGHVVNYSVQDTPDITESRNLTRREKFKRKKALSIKRKFFSKSSKKDDINLKALDLLFTQAKGEGLKKRKAKKNRIGESKFNRIRKKSGKEKLKIFN